MSLSTIKPKTHLLYTSLCLCRMGPFNVRHGMDCSAYCDEIKLVLFFKHLRFLALLDGPKNLRVSRNFKFV